MQRKDTNGKPLELGKRYLCGPRGHRSRVAITIEEDPTSGDTIAVSSQSRMRLDEISSAASFEPITPANQATSAMMSDREYLESVDRVAADLRRQMLDLQIQIENLASDALDHLGIKKGEMRRVIGDWIHHGTDSVDGIVNRLEASKKGSN